MTLPFNYETLKSSFDKRSTLLNQLKDMEDTFSAAGLTGIEVVDSTDTSLKLKMTFADGSSFTTSAINIKGAKGDTGPQGPQGPQGAAGGITNINGYTGPVTTGDGLTFSNGTLNSYDFNLVDTDTFDISTATDTRISSFWGTVYKALNQSGTVGKIYGVGYFTVANSITDGAVDIDTGFTVSAPATSFFIYTGINCIAIDANTNNQYLPTTLYIDTTGKVYLHWYLTTTIAGKNFIWQLPACLYFFKDFGDTPQAQTLSMRMAALEHVESEER